MSPPLYPSLPFPQPHPTLSKPPAATSTNQESGPSPLHHPCCARTPAPPFTIAGVPTPAHTLFIITPALRTSNPSIWDADAAAFDPDRHDRLPSAAQDPFAIEAFTAGLRVCTGKAFALLEFKAIMVGLVRGLVAEGDLGRGPGRVSGCGYVEAERGG